MTPVSQIYEKRIAPSVIQIFIKQHHFLAGEIHQTENIFYSIPRSSKNLFHLFHGAVGGLGMNEEILLRKDYKIIKIKYCDKIFTTTRLKWLKQGVISPYCNALVDKQIILSLERINMLDDEKFPEHNKQITLFQEVEL